MNSNNWKKVENEAGYPLFIDSSSGKKQYDHPEFLKITECLQECNKIKYTAYRVAFKIFALQRHLKVPSLRVSSGVFARHKLSLSESSLSIDTAELEDVLGDIYFAADKEGQFNGDVDMAVDLLINLLLNVYDKDRKEPIRVLAAKTLLICLSKESVSDKWAALANSCADHNGCVSPKRLTLLLTHVTALSHFLGSSGDTLQADVEACFAKNAGMLGLSSRTVAEWGTTECKSTRWLAVVQRVVASRQTANTSTLCACCSLPLNQVLQFQCTKCSAIYFCEKCYLYDKDMTSVSGHKKSHTIHEIVDGQPNPSECLSFIKGMKRFFFCTKTKKRKTSKSNKNHNKETGSTRNKKDGKPTIFTSTVGKASGNKDNPTLMLQDIINQLETQNKALQELTSQPEETAKINEDLKAKVDSYWTQISTQINRLKLLKDNLIANQPEFPTEAEKQKPDRPQAFDLFSPISVIEEKQSKVGKNINKQARVLNLVDSGSFSVVSNSSQKLLTVSGDDLKLVAAHPTSDSISAVSVNDISTWYNEPESLATAKRTIPLTISKPPDITACEQKYASDNLSVETSNDMMKELNADLDTVLDRLQQILASNFAADESCFDNSQLRETANEMEGLLGTLIRGVEQRVTLNATKGLL